MPHPLDVADLADQALRNHIFGGLVELAIAPLQANLEDLLRPLVGKRPQRVDLFGLEDQALLAKHVLAGQQDVASNGEMLVQGRDHDHGVDVLARQQILIVSECLRIGARERDALLQIRRVVVAYGDALAVVQTAHVAQ